MLGSWLRCAVGAWLLLRCRCAFHAQACNQLAGLRMCGVSYVWVGQLHASLSSKGACYNMIYPLRAAYNCKFRTDALKRQQAGHSFVTLV